MCIYIYIHIYRKPFVVEDVDNDEGNVRKLDNTSGYICTYIYTHIYIHTHTHKGGCSVGAEWEYRGVHPRGTVPVGGSVRISISKYTHIYIYIYIYICIYIYIYIYIHTYTHIHIHIHTHTHIHIWHRFAWNMSMITSGIEESSMAPLKNGM